MEASNEPAQDGGDNLSPLRVSKRLRRRPTYFTPNYKIESSVEDDVTFRGVVTDHKGFQDFEDSVSFKCMPAWRLNHVLSRLAKELKVDPKGSYVWTVWNEELNSTRYAEWERLTAFAQIKNKDVSKLRIYKVKKPAQVRKKPPPPKPKETPRPLQQQTQPAVQQLPMQGFPFFSPQDMMMANYLMMMYTAPWMFMPPFQ